MALQMLSDSKGWRRRRRVGGLLRLVPEEAVADGHVPAQLLAEAGAKLVRVHYAKPAALGEPLLTIQQAIHAESMYDLSGAGPCIRDAFLEPPMLQRSVCACADAKHMHFLPQ